ncbi:hypothetical protein D920_02156 [Enterococcus faecalis 13-SD-W-01]|nr:hypothetical protein D920_02156 [Enterococcus faecalis 13-SD-W-01]
MLIEKKLSFFVDLVLGNRDSIFCIVFPILCLFLILVVSAIIQVKKKGVFP